MKEKLLKVFKFSPLSITILTIVIVTSSYFMKVQFLDLMELRTIDLRFKQRGAIEQTGQVVLAVVDEKSISKEGKWVWPRSKFAKMIDNLSEAGASVVGFDVGFLEPDAASAAATISKVKQELHRTGASNEKIEAFLDEIIKTEDYDQILANSIKNSTAKIVLGFFFHLGEGEGLEHITEDEISQHEDNIMGALYSSVNVAEGADEEILNESKAPQSNIQLLSEATDYSGFFNMAADMDGVVRWAITMIRFNDDYYASLPLVSASAHYDVPIAARIDAGYGVSELSLGDMQLPVDEFGRIVVNFRGGEKTFPHIPITDIINKTTDMSIFKDKIVLVGATAIGIFDLRVTPFGEVFPGLEIHANVLDSILSKDFMFRPSWAGMFDVLAIILMGSFLGFLLPKADVAVGAVSAIAVFVGYIALCQYLFSSSGYILNLIYPLGGVLIIYVAITAYKYLSEASEKKFIRGAFSTYMAPAVVNELLANPKMLDLGGEERVITAFFSDVQGFTSISEKLTASELVELLNEFLTEMTDIILENKGTVDKFEGDAIIAMFGAPVAIENQAEVACRTCLIMQDRLAQMRVRLREEGRPELKMRIGLSTGPAVVGNMGSSTRMDYTMMGDTVNTAARLEGVNKVYGIFLLVHERTYHEASASGEIFGREIDSINVVGKTEPVSVFQVLCLTSDLDDRTKQIAKNYEMGLKAYRGQQWDDAIKQFEATLAIDPEDGPSKTMLQRTQTLKADPPAKDWNGAYAMTSK